MFIPGLSWDTFDSFPLRRMKDTLTYIAHKSEEDEATSYIERCVYSVLNKIFKGDGD